MKSGSKLAFTLVELMVVLGLIVVLMGAMTVSMNGAQQRARISKAETEVKMISEAILAYENFDEDHELPTMKDRDASGSSLSFLLGSGGTSEAGDRIPTILLAHLGAGDMIRDPWNTPYKVTIIEGTIDGDDGSGPIGGSMSGSGHSDLQTGFYYPNYYRLSLEERQ